MRETYQELVTRLLDRLWSGMGSKVKRLRSWVGQVSWRCGLALVVERTAREKKYVHLRRERRARKWGEEPRKESSGGPHGRKSSISDAGLRGGRHHQQPPRFSWDLNAYANHPSRRDKGKRILLWLASSFLPPQFHIHRPWIVNKYQFCYNSFDEN